MMKHQDKIKRGWHLIDAKGRILGRLASEIAVILQGKHKPGFLPYLDQGDWVVIINAREIKTTGNKGEQKIYYHYTGYPGGIRGKKLNEAFQDDPAWVLKTAVSGMLPKNKLQKPRLKRLEIFEEDKHPYQERFK